MTMEFSKLQSNFNSQAIGSQDIYLDQEENISEFERHLANKLEQTASYCNQQLFANLKPKLTANSKTLLSLNNTLASFPASTISQHGDIIQNFTLIYKSYLKQEEINNEQLHKILVDYDALIKKLIAKENQEDIIDKNDKKLEEIQQIEFDEVQAPTEEEEEEVDEQQEIAIKMPKLENGSEELSEKNEFQSKDFFIQN